VLQLSVYQANMRDLQEANNNADKSAAAYRQEVALLQAQLEESQQRCRFLENAVTHSETEKRDLLEHLSKLVQAVEERDAKLKEQVTVRAA
jgi:hypothetical protein